MEVEEKRFEQTEVCFHFLTLCLSHSSSFVKSLRRRRMTRFKWFFQIFVVAVQKLLSVAGAPTAEGFSSTSSSVSPPPSKFHHFTPKTQLKCWAAVFLYSNPETIQVRTKASVRIEDALCRAVEIRVLGFKWHAASLCTENKHTGVRSRGFSSPRRMSSFYLKWTHFTRNKHRRLPSWRPQFPTESPDVIYANVIMHFFWLSKSSAVPSRLFRTI